MTWYMRDYWSYGTRQHCEWQSTMDASRLLLNCPHCDDGYEGMDGEGRWEDVGESADVKGCKYFDRSQTFWFSAKRMFRAVALVEKTLEGGQRWMFVLRPYHSFYLPCSACWILKDWYQSIFRFGSFVLFVRNPDEFIFFYDLFIYLQSLLLAYRQSSPFNNYCLS